MFKVLEPYGNIYVVEPVESTNPVYLCFLEQLNLIQVNYIVVCKEDIWKKLLENACFFFFHEDEKRGMQCMYEIANDRNGHLYNIESNSKFITYVEFLSRIMKEEELEDLEIQHNFEFNIDRIDEKLTLLLTALEEGGTKCFCVHSDKLKFPIELVREISSRKEGRLRDEMEQWIHKDECKGFYDELYKIEDYEKEIAQREICYGQRNMAYQQNIVGKYFNAKDGRRVTCYQPEEYEGTIYFFGPCIAIGAYTEDKYTIESYLQKKLREKGYKYRVENYGDLLRLDGRIDTRIAEIGDFCSKDIVIVLSESGEAVGIQGMVLEEMLEKYRISSEWLYDSHSYFHCNHKVNKLVADSIFDMIKSGLQHDKTEVIKKNDVNIDEVMKMYVKNKYLNRYFADFPVEDYGSIGAIVMNCNPFSKGHRYLIEQAASKVEFLIVFAVEEDASLFSFEERFKMISDGTKDLDNVKVVPSGGFILSRNNFIEYFAKLEDEMLEINAEYDINVFVDYIVGPLNITHRFAGEEPEDRVTKVYNETMRRILPGKGVAFVEFPRISVGDEIVSASRIRKYLRDGKYDKMYALVPETTKSFLMAQM